LFLPTRERVQRIANMPERFQVVVTDSLAEAGPETDILQDIAEIRLLGTNDEADVARHATEADVLLVYHTIKLTERSIATLRRCRGIIRCGVGYDNVDLEAAGRRGIVVCNVPDYGTEEVADHALLLLLALARRLLPAHAAVRAGRWDPSCVFGTPRSTRARSPSCRAVPTSSTQRAARALIPRHSCTAWRAVRLPSPPWTSSRSSRSPTSACAITSVSC
jgi:hypothetical protein